MLYNVYTVYTAPTGSINAFIYCQGRLERILEWADELLKKNVGLGGRMDWTGWMYTP